MRLQAQNRLTMTKKSIAARRASAQEDCYSWVWVLPVPSGQFRVTAIEVPKRFIDNDWCFYEADFTRPYDKHVDRINQIDNAVREAGVDPEDLDAPWYSDFPL